MNGLPAVVSQDWLRFSPVGPPRFVVNTCGVSINAKSKIGFVLALLSHLGASAPHNRPSPSIPCMHLRSSSKPASFSGMVHQRRFWGNTRGLSADLGRGPKQVEICNLCWVAPFVPSPQALQHRARIGLFGDWLDTFQVPVLRFSTLGPACHPRAFPVQAPDKAPETSTWSPGSEGGRQLARPRPRRQPDRVQAGRG